MTTISPSQKDHVGRVKRNKIEGKIPYIISLNINGNWHVVTIIYSNSIKLFEITKMSEESFTIRISFSPTVSFNFIPQKKKSKQITRVHP